MIAERLAEGDLVWMAGALLVDGRAEPFNVACTVERVLVDTAIVRFGPAWAKELGGELLEVALDKLRRTP